jgi:hypothetical protein
MRVAWNAQVGDVFEVEIERGLPLSFEVIETLPHGVIAVLTNDKFFREYFLSYMGLFEKEARYLRKVS